MDSEFYVVHNDNDEYLCWVTETYSMDMGGHIDAEPYYEFLGIDVEYAQRFDTRKEAASVAYDYAGKVRRVTITIEDMDLRWLPGAVLNDRIYLYDGPHATEEVYIRNGGYEWRGETYDDLHEAKQVAEQAVMDAWT